jgi:hypothetical protein
MVLHIRSTIFFMYVECIILPLVESMKVHNLFTFRPVCDTISKTYPTGLYLPKQIH